MEEIFISEIYLKEARVVKDLSIEFPNSERKHLILTGKNGCGKTTVLIELNKYLSNIFNNRLGKRQQYINNIDRFSSQLTQIQSGTVTENTKTQISQIKENIQNTQNALNQFGNAEIKFTNEHQLVDKVKNGDFIIAYFDAKGKQTLKSLQVLTRLI